MYDYYKSISGRLSMIANILLIISVVTFFINWRYSIYIFIVVMILYIVSLIIHNIRLRKQKLLDMLSEGIDQSKMGLYSKFKNIYAKEYDISKAGFMAGALVNVLLSEESSNEEGRNFIQRNKSTILNEIKKYRKDIDLCNIVTRTVQSKIILYSSQGLNDEKYIIKPLERISQLGIQIKNTKLLSPNRFLSLTHKYLLENYNGE